MLTKKSLDILILLNKESDLSEIASNLNLSQRTIRYEIENLNYYLTRFGYDEIQIISKKINKPKNFDYYKMLSNLKKDNYSYSKEERINYVIANYVFNSFNFKQSDIEEKLDVSSTTVSNDMLKIKNLLLLDKINFNSYAKDFEYLSGSEKNIRRFQLNFLLDYLLTDIKYPDEVLIKGIIDDFFHDINIEEIRLFIRKVQEKLNKIISDEAYKILTLYLMISIKRIKQENLLTDISNSAHIVISDEFKIISELSNDLEKRFDVKLNEEEVISFSEYVLGSHSYNFDYSYYENWIQLEILVNKLIIDINSKIDIDILGDHILFEGLLNHLKPSIYRIKQGIKLENSIYEEVLYNYPELFNMIKRSMNRLIHYLEVDVGNDEIAFVTIHFKEAINRREEKTLKNILIVCGFGYGSSKLLKENIKKYFEVNVINTLPLHKYEEIEDFSNIDLIVSTVPIKESSIPVVHVSPILTKENLEKLEHYGLDKERKLIYVEDILDIVRNYADIRDEKGLESKLIKKYKNKIKLKTENKQHNLETILSKENIYSNLSFDNWKEALYFGGKILEEKEAVNSKYVKSIINILEKQGSYMILNDHILLAHGKNDDNVFKTSMILMLLKDYVKFPDNKDIKMILFFSSKDNKEHLNALLKITELLDENKLYEKIKNLTTSDEIYKTILSLI